MFMLIVTEGFDYLRLFGFEIECNYRFNIQHYYNRAVV